MLRRKRLPPELAAAREAFDAVLAEVEPAKAALADCMPSTRMPGRPLPDALSDYENHLERARGLMRPWREPRLETEWLSCEAGLDEALALAGRLRREAPELGGFEGLLGTVESLMDPLDAFAAAADRFRALRTSRPPGSRQG
ncbi:MAG: hypothetical protein ABI572_03295 [Actinomycetota bacterium]